MELVFSPSVLSRLRPMLDPSKLFVNSMIVAVNSMIVAGSSSSASRVGVASALYYGSTSALQPLPSASSSTSSSTVKRRIRGKSSPAPSSALPSAQVPQRRLRITRKRPSDEVAFIDRVSRLRLVLVLLAQLCAF